MSKIDYSIAGLVGFLVGIFVIPTAVSLGTRNVAVLLGAPWVLAPLFVFGLWIGGLLSRRLSFFRQFSKFLAVGFLNTAIDFGVLNLLSAATGITAGLIIGGVNAPGFVIAAANSYFWNKFWVFGKVDGRGVFADLPKFFAVVLTGAVLNGLLIAAGTSVAPAFTGLAPTLTLNAVKAAATGVTFLWNFLGLKLFVFRRP